MTGDSVADLLAALKAATAGPTWHAGALFDEMTATAREGTPRGGWVAASEPAALAK